MSSCCASWPAARPGGDRAREAGQVVPGCEPAIASLAAQELDRHGVRVETGVSVEAIERRPEDGAGGDGKRRRLAERPHRRPATGLWVPGRRDCESCEDTRRLLEEVAALSDKITLRVHDVSAEPQAAMAAGLEADQVPALLITGAAKGRARFLGIPAGLEFATLLSSLIDVARGLVLRDASGFPAWSDWRRR